MRIARVVGLKYRRTCRDGSSVAKGPEKLLTAVLSATVGRIADVERMDGEFD